jgi:hypothetical protein
MYRRKSTDQEQPTSLAATGAFLSGLFQDLQVDMGKVEIVSDNARTKRIRELVLQTAEGQHSQRSRCRWTNIVEDVIKSPSTMSTASTSSHRTHLHSPTSPPGEQRHPSAKVLDTDLPMPIRRVSREVLQWDEIVVDKQNISTSSRRSSLTFEEEADCLATSQPVLPPAEGRFSSPSTSTSTERRKRLHFPDHMGPLKAPTRQISLEKEVVLSGHGSGGDEIHVTEYSLKLAASEKETSSNESSPSDKALPSLVPHRMGFLNKEDATSGEVHEQVSPSASPAQCLVKATSLKQHSWNERYSQRRHESPQLEERPRVTRASSVSYLGSSKGAKDATATLAKRLSNRVDRILFDESMQQISSVGGNSDHKNPYHGTSHESASSLESCATDAIPSLPIRRGSIEKELNKKRRQSIPPLPKQPVSDAALVESSTAATITALSLAQDVIDPFANDTARSESRSVSQPGLLRSVDVRTPTPPRSLLRSNDYPTKRKVAMLPPPSVDSPSVETTTVLTDIMSATTGTLQNDEEDEDDDTNSLSTCSTIYSNTGDR